MALKSPISKKNCFCYNFSFKWLVYLEWWIQCFIFDWMKIRIKISCTSWKKSSSYFSFLTKLFNNYLQFSVKLPYVNQWYLITVNFKMCNLVRVVRNGWKSFKIIKPQFKFKISETYYYGRKYNPPKRNVREYFEDNLCMITAVVTAVIIRLNRD